jgi:hypothetical protein
VFVGSGPYGRIARVKYSAYGKPTILHPMDFDGDGLVGGVVGGFVESAEVTEDRAAREEALGHAPHDGDTGVVDAKLRAWRALANVTGGEPHSVNAGDPAWKER